MAAARPPTTCFIHIAYGSGGRVRAYCEFYYETCSRPKSNPYGLT